LAGPCNEGSIYSTWTDITLIDDYHQVASALDIYFYLFLLTVDLK